MVGLADLAAATPGRVSEIAARLGATEREVRKAIQVARRRGHKVDIVGRQGRFNIYKVALQKRRERHNVLRSALAPIPQPRVLREAPEATAQQARAVMAERVTRDCMRCKTRISTTRHGPRFCDPCRRYITSIS
jgi:biotin operon repressor